MSQATNYAETQLFNVLLRSVAFTAPANHFLALHTANPTETGAVGEVSGGGYARQAIDFDAPVDGVASNDAAIAFTASGANFGLITHWSIHDASSGGNALVYGTMTTSRQIDDGDTLNFAIGSVTVTVA